MGLIDSLATTEALGRLFSDASVLQAMLLFEASLARAEARVGVIPQADAETIAAAAKGEDFDLEILIKQALRAGTPGIPLVKALRERVQTSNSTAASFVHWGATSQDLTDTALILLLKNAQPIFESGQARLEKSLRRLSDEHANAVMLGRTLMQPAPPLTFGLKAAGWFGALQRSRHRLSASFNDSLILQFGGASGTLALLGGRGIEVGKVLADELGLKYPDAPWHTHRDRLAALLGACGVLAGSLGKMARDISLLSQAEVGEVSESADSGRGGSSTMPHKQNPIGCVLTLAAANRVPGFVATFLSGMVQEHERGAGGWQAEWSTVSAVIQSTGLAIESMAEVVESLTINSGRMRSNIEATNGTVFAEKAMGLLTPNLGRDAAGKLLETATRQAMAEGRRLAEVLTSMPQIRHLLNAKALEDMEIPELYLGVGEEFRQNLLRSNRPRENKKD